MESGNGDCSGAGQGDGSSGNAYRQSNGSSGGGTFSFDPFDLRAVEAVDNSGHANEQQQQQEDEEEEAVEGAVGGVNAAAAPIPPNPSTPRIFCEPEGPPDTEDNVCEQADGVFRSFVFERFTRDRDQGRLEPGTPNSPELERERPNPISQEARIGRQLAQIGDEIQLKYQHQFNDMLKLLDDQLTDSESSFDVFRRVAVRLFRDGEVNWGRVVALFFFGYRVAVEKICHGVTGFLRQIVDWICRFLVTERIASWIAAHGGWRSVSHITFRGEDSQVNWRLVASLGALAAICLVVFRYSRQQ